MDSSQEEIRQGKDEPRATKSSTARSCSDKGKTAGSGKGTAKPTKPGKAKPTPPAQHKTSGKPKALPPAVPGEAQPTPPAPSTGHPPTATRNAGDTETQGIMTRLEKIESLFDRMIPFMENFYHANSEMSHSYPHAEDPFSRSGMGFDEHDSAVIELADDRSVANFLTTNQVQDHVNDDAVSLFSGISQGQVGDRSKPDKIPAMAQKFATPTGIGEPLDEDIADTITFMMGQKLDPKPLGDAAARYPCPSNCFPLETPKVNPTIWENISTSTRHRDLKLQLIQTSLLKGINAFARSLPPELSEAQEDAMALLCDANFALNCMRKDCIKPDMNSTFHHLCKPTHKVTKFLFGDDLGRQVKEIQEQKKTMSGMMKSRFSRDQPMQRFHPYKKQDSSRRVSSNSNAGLVRRMGLDFDRRTAPSNVRPGNPAQPFLGKASRGRSRETPHSYTPTAARDKHPSYHRQSQGRK